MGRMADEPHGAALTTPNDFAMSPGAITGCEGRNGAKWALLFICQNEGQKRSIKRDQAYMISYFSERQGLFFVNRAEKKNDSDL